MRSEPNCLSRPTRSNDRIRVRLGGRQSFAKLIGRYRFHLLETAVFCKATYSRAISQTIAALKRFNFGGTDCTLFHSTDDKHRPFDEAETSNSFLGATEVFASLKP